MAVAERAGRRRQLGVAQAARPMGFGRRFERPDERHLLPQGDLDVASPGELEDGAGVLGNLAGRDVAGDAGDREQVRLVRGAGIEERQGVVDAGVDVEDQGDALSHEAILAARHVSGRGTNGPE